MSAAVVVAGPLMHGDVPLGEAIAFWILGPIALAGAIGMVLFRNAIHSALSLVATMMCLGAFYVIEQGPFLGLVQIIVYTGAIMILFLFVLMLVGRDASDSIVETLRGQRWAAALFGIGFALLVAISVGRALRDEHPTDLNGPNANGSNVHSIAALLFTKYLFAFELTSALLIIAAVGAMVLAHIEREGRRPTQKALARERIRSGRPQPLPGPGVLSTGNSIGTPALLPDGTISHESVMVGAEDFTEIGGANPRALDPADYGDSEVRQ
jgi:NADH-quinone oxidoreductase subunit J